MAGRGRFWQTAPMGNDIASARVRTRLIDGLYVEAMVLADEARTYFDDFGKLERDSLDPMARVAFSCESLKVTTRLMHIIAWLLTQRAVQAGEMAARDALDPSRRLGNPPVTEPAALLTMPAQAQALIASSIELFRRTARLDMAQTEAVPLLSPVRALQRRLETTF